VSAGPTVRASVIVPTRDRPESLSACLRALDAQRFDAFEIVVVDDASRDRASVADVVATSSRARVVHAAGRGPAAARNLGAADAHGSVVCFTDDDCRPSPGWVDALVTCIDGGAVAAAGPTINGRPRDPLAAAAQTVTNHLVEASLDATSHVGFAPTSNLACLATLQRELPFDERYPLAAGEDRDWCTRLVALGHRLAYVPSATIAHHPSLSLGGFWKQQSRYGRGAQRWHNGAGARDGFGSAGFYTSLVRKGFAGGVEEGALVLLAQVATASGYAREAVGSRARI
jgi:glycosyltransferase involved in cell wall biosynthesis